MFVTAQVGFCFTTSGSASASRCTGSGLPCIRLLVLSVLEGLGRGTLWAKTGLYMSTNPCTARVLCKRSAALPNTVKGDNPHHVKGYKEEMCTCSHEENDSLLGPEIRSFKTTRLNCYCKMARGFMHSEQLSPQYPLIGVLLTSGPHKLNAACSTPSKGLLSQCHADQLLLKQGKSLSLPFSTHS
jgi:hypothetical protein